MNEKELKYRVVNKLLNRVMKKKYGDFVFYLVPVNYLMNNEMNCDYISRTEIISVNIKTPINMILRDRLELEIKHHLNTIISVVEGNSKLKVDRVKLKFNQPVLSGTLFVRN
jgi:hypothetical protein